MKVLLLMVLVEVLEALHCDKEFNYYDNYGNGFDVTCEGLTNQHIHLLENITITNEITLYIENSTLNNVSSKIFQKVDNIRYLHLENSTFTFPRKESIFNLFRRLEHLTVINTQFFINKYTFVGLSRLQELVFENNDLQDVDEGAFLNLPSLAFLEITGNKISNLKTLPLCELPSLKSLNLSRNIISDLRNAHFYCRKPEKTVDFSLNNENYILDVKKRDYFSVSENSAKLKILDLSYNNISKLEFALADLANLKVLNLEGNKLVFIKKKEISSLINIEKIHLRNNSLSSIEDGVFYNQKYLEYLDISKNNLNYFSLNNTPILDYLNLADNMINVLSLSNINNTKSLKTLILYNNKINDIHRYTFKKFSSVELLDVGNNNIKLQDNLFEGLSHLNYLSLRNNNITALPKFIFSNLTNLRHLDLSYNKLKYFTYNDTFNHLENLETLNISYNFLQELNYAILEPLKELNILDIAGNQLHYIQYELIISDLPQLSVLNIKSNLLSCELLFQIIKFLKHKSITYTINEDFNYEQENVAGIYCNTEKNIVSQSLRNSGMSSESYTLIVLVVIVSLVIGIIVIGVSVFKIHLFLKRRKYRADEFELVDE